MLIFTEHRKKTKEKETLHQTVYIYECSIAYQSKLNWKFYVMFGLFLVHRFVRLTNKFNHSNISMFI